MYVYFDREGNIKEIIYKPVRQGDLYKQVIYIYWENHPTPVNNFNVKVKKSDGTYANIELLNTQKQRAEIPYDNERDLYFFKYDTPYDFFVFRPKFTYPSGLNAVSFYFSIGGQTIGGELVGASLHTLQILPFNVEASAELSGGSPINESQYSELVALLKNNNVKAFNSTPTQLEIENIGIGALIYNLGDNKIYKVNNNYQLEEWVNANAVAWGQITGTLANQVDLINALNGKQPTITDELTINELKIDRVPDDTYRIINASDEDTDLLIKSTYGDIVLSTPTGNAYINGAKIQKELVAGNNITLTQGTNNTTINATDTTYTAGTGISISGNVISATGGTYSAGNGLSLNGTTFSVDTSVIATQSDLTGKENSSNKVSSVVASDTQFPTNNAVISFVNSSIATNTANFLGQLDVVTDLGLSYGASTSAVATALNNHTFSVTPSNNDYCVVVNKDTNNNIVNQRYKYAINTFLFEYAINNSSFTATQWSAINSGITDVGVAKIATNESAINGIKNGTNINSFSGVESALNGKQNSFNIGEGLQFQNNVLQVDYLDVQAKLSTEQMNAVNSGITSGKVSTYDGYASGKQNTITNANKLSASLVSGLSNVATSGSYNDLSNKPTIPTTTSQLTNNSGFITSSYHDSTKQDVIDSSHKLSADLVNDSNSTNKFITASERVNWNNKQGALSTSQLNAVNSGITSAKVGTYDGYATSKQDKLTSNTAIEVASVEVKDLMIDENGSKYYINNNSATILNMDINNSQGVLNLLGTQVQYNGSEIAKKSDLSSKQDTIDASHKVPYAYISGTPTIPSKTSQLTNDSGFTTSQPVYKHLLYVEATNCAKSWESGVSDYGVYFVCYNNSQTSITSVPTYRIDEADITERKKAWTFTSGDGEAGAIIFTGGQVCSSAFFLTGVLETGTIVSVRKTNSSVISVVSDTVEEI